MSINVTNSQGTKIYIGPTQGAFADCAAAVAAITAMAVVDCPQSIGEITQSRNTTEYKCLSSNESAKALGAVSRASITIEMLLDPSNTAGQKVIREAFRDNTDVLIGIAFGNVIQYFTAGISSIATGIAQDSAISYKATVEISSDIKECPTSGSGGGGGTTPTGATVANNGNVVMNNANTVTN